MAFSDKFFQALGLQTNAELNAAQANLNASYVSNEETIHTGLASPWSDNSHLETMVIADLYGLTTDQLPITRKSAMGIASLFKGRNLICTSVARMPIQAVKNGTPLATQPSLLTQLQTGVTNFEVLVYTVDSMLFYGRAFWLISEKSFDGRPLKIRYIPEGQLELDDNGILVKAFGKNVGPKDYIRFNAVNSGILDSGLGAIREAIEIENAAREAGSSPVPSIVLKNNGEDLSAEKVSAMRAMWTALRRGRGGSVAYVNKNIDVESMGAHAENLLIQGRNQASLQMARLLGLPAWAVDATVQGTSLSYTNQASRNREIIDCLTAYMVSIEQTISLFLPNGTEAKFDTTELLRSDTKDRYDAYKVAIEIGVLTANEARSYENLEPLQDEPTESPVEPLPTIDKTEETNE